MTCRGLSFFEEKGLKHTELLETIFMSLIILK